MTEPPPTATARPLRIVLVTLGSIGDLLPFLGLSLALRARGHGVTLAMPAPHREVVARDGLDAWPLGDDEHFQALLRNPALWDPRRAFGALWEGIMAITGDIGAAIAAAGPTGPDLVIGHPLAMPAIDLARARLGRLRVVAVQLAPANLRTLHDPLHIGPLAIPRWMPMAWRRAIWRYADHRFVDRFTLPSLNAERARLGLAPVPGLVAHMQAVADAHLALFPPGFAAQAPDWPRPMFQAGFIRHDPAAQDPLADDLDAFLRAGEPPVVVTLGTVQRQATGLYTQLAQAVLAAGRRPLVLCREPPPLPAGAHWLPYAPLARVLPHAAGLVHHGGIGTSAEGLAAGLPQLVLPFAFDQFDNAARLVALGVARALPAARAGVRRLRHTVPAWVQDEPLRARARAAATLPAPGLEAACAWLETAVAAPVPKA